LNAVNSMVARVGGIRIALGAERLALIPFRTPRVAVIVALALAVLAIAGIQRIRVDDSLSQLFHSKSPAFKLFEQVSHDFPSSEYDVMIVVTGDVLSRNSVDRLRSLVTDVQLIEGTRGALSMFSARQPAPLGGLPEPIFPEPLPQGSAYHELVERALNNDIIHGRLLSADGRLALVILSLNPAAVDGGGSEKIVNDVRQAIAEDLQGTGLTAELTGVPVMQLEIRRALERDRLLYNAVGFALGCVIAALFNCKARRQDACSSCVGVGGTARDRSPDHLDHASAHPRELRNFFPARRRHARDSRQHNGERPVQSGGGDRCAWIYTQDQ